MIPVGYSGQTIAIMLIMLYIGFVVGIDLGSTAYLHGEPDKQELRSDLTNASQNITAIENDFARGIAMPAYRSMTNVMMKGYNVGYAWPRLALPLALMPLFLDVYVFYRKLVSLIS